MWLIFILEKDCRLTLALFGNIIVHGKQVSDFNLYVFLKDPEIKAGDSTWVFRLEVQMYYRLSTDE